jgi:hypothetical protein
MIQITELKNRQETITHGDKWTQYQRQAFRKRLLESSTLKRMTVKMISGTKPQTAKAVTQTIIDQFNYIT